MAGPIDDRLFDETAKEFARYCALLAAHKDRDILPFPPHELETIGRILFANLQHGGYCTIALNGRTRWEPRSVYYEMCRMAARNGARIERDFLLPYRHLKNDPLLQEHLRLDREVGIIANIRYVGDLLTNATLPPLESIEFGIWDDALACTTIYDTRSNQVAEYRVSRRPEDVSVLTHVSALLRSAPIIAESADRHLEEPMMITAPVAHALAPVLCRGDYVAQEDCSWYHGIWQYLRILNMVSTPTWHANFYLSTIAEAIKEAPGRILISGAADYSTLAHVLWGCETAAPPIPCPIDVVDLCETPLLLCRWYGKYAGADVTTHQADILTYAADPYRLIVTDAFLTRFNSNARQEVLKAWHRQLAPGGRVITTVRLEPELRSAFAIASSDQANSFRTRALQNGRRWREFIPIAPEDLGNEAQRYAERMTSFSVRNEQELRQAFTDAGFDDVQIINATVPGEMSTTTYAELVATKAT